MELVKENFWTIPNLISILRIFAVPYFGYLIYYDRMVDASILFLCMAISDFLDGFLARKLNQISRIGKMLDPLADKLVILVTIVVIGVFSNKYLMPNYFVFIILLKEIYLLSGILTILIMRKKFLVRTFFIGKITMFLEYLTVVMFLLSYFLPAIYPFLEISYLLTSVSAVISIIVYTVKN
ncbi:MAG: CDP-alcohol phosphatidyltransferase family protein [Calditerrivibrio sp.]|nr:CDP-alcohol phosphatidyltransferase family protein [Calditerrivibrio sp.]MCA1932103.1 CDP-alcohol phosphatidyltransferase family protein [Calditerrivibrio sp.]